ncbi:hypothetical protein CRE_16973 [Caenorhabditis remanei]|uniref:Serpentine Receptor, class Z n=1 Tax=Caenorhabditis remanei TaxID=31234 RepID=E3N2D6_CAERE|nr:hypothetical protein CRE_16973 [Caenorhabditis remanei]
MAFFDEFDIQHLPELLLFAYIIGVIFVLICFCVLLPFYAYVYKINRERDKKSAVFPIVDHFFEMIKKFYYLVSCFIPCVIFVSLTSNDRFQTARNAVSTVMIFIIFLLHIIVEVLHLLISYLAIQRCLLFLFESYEKQLVVVQNKILSKIWYLYILFIAFDFINIMLDPMCAMNPCSERKTFQAKIIRKFSHLPVSRQNKPERYILIQMVATLLFKSIAVFPIFDHLYEMIKKFYYLVSCVIPCIIFVHYISNEGTTRDAVAIVMAFILFLLHIIVEVLHLLISYLAIQRCLLFLFDSFEKQLVAVQNMILSNIWYLYILFIAIDIINLIYVPLKNPSNERKIFQAKMFFLVTWLFYNFLLVLSAFLYIPIIISIRKLSHLPVARQNKPEQYILIQMVATLVFKSTCIPILLAWSDVESNFLSIKFLFYVLDIFVIPVIIQFSYLFCNKRNVKTLLSSFDLIQFLKVILNLRVEVPVQPMSFTQSSAQYVV